MSGWPGLGALWRLSLPAAAALWATAAAQPEFGGPEDVAFAARLWRSLGSAGLVGDGAWQSRAYPGRQPHGAVLQRFQGRIDLDGGPAQVRVLRNYRGAGVGVQAVAENPRRHLSSVSVMFRRPGYDPANRDWFWAEYDTDGEPKRDPEGLYLAGRVGGARAPGGCIGCHAAAGSERLFGG